MADPSVYPGPVSIREYFEGSIAAKKAVMETLEPSLLKAGQMIAKAVREGGKWMLCGNGGSAADAQHLAAEMVGRLYKLERPGLAALALTTDSSVLTCVGNDYSFEDIFARQVEALARPGDCLLGISTSGKSPNVLKALEAARRRGCATLGFSGGDGGKMKACCDLELRVPSDKTYHVQEAHIAMGHWLCFAVEKELLQSGALNKNHF